KNTGPKTALQRKAQTETLLRSMNIPYIDHLPLLEEEEEARLRSPQDVAKRILVLTYLGYVSEVPDSKPEVVQFLQEQDIWNHASAHEKELFAKDLTEQEQINISWRSEATWLLLWAIHRVERLDIPVHEVNIADILQRLPGLLEDTGTFVQQASLRPASQILDTADLTYRLHWAVRHTQLNNLKPLAVNPGIIEERHYAVNWLTYYADDWDDVTTDT
ncbi:MAG: DUF4272 domain-containing protein, partial [Bacteroidota bacterium]|nr:DUF4272 domain-containing protein [Bacteroidota bacterium]